MFKQQYTVLLCAMSILTRIPVPLQGDYSKHIAQSCRYFSFVGLLLGLAQALVFWCLVGVFGHSIAAIMTIIIGMVLTGAIHEDGLADTFDSLGGRSLEVKLRIMKDSQLGVYGVLALLCNLFLKTAILLQLSLHSIDAVIIALIISQSLSRAICITPAVFLPYLRVDDGKLPIHAFETLSIILSWLFSLLLIILLAAQPHWLILGGLIFTVIWMQFIRKIFTGYTGDILGCGQQLAELCILAISLVCGKHVI